MASCFDPAARAEAQKAMRVSSQIEQQLRQDRRHFNEVVTLVLVGDKRINNIILNLLLIIHGENNNFLGRVFSNSMTTADEVQLDVIIKNMQDFTISSFVKLRTMLAARNVNLADPANTKLLQEIESAEANKLAKIPDIGTKIHTIWKDATIGPLVDVANSEIDERERYFVSHAERILSPTFFIRKYTIADILTFGYDDRVGTIREIAFHDRDLEFKLICLGDTPSNKWLHHFEMATGAILTVYMPNFARTLPDGTNALHDDQQKFSSFVNYRYFQNQSAILYLHDKLTFDDMTHRRNINLNTCLPDFNESKEYAAEFVRQYFIDANNSNKSVYAHFTHTDVQNQEIIFRCLQDIILHKTLSCIGLADAGFSSPRTPAPKVSKPKTLGLAVGGAKDIVNFRSQLRRGKIPDSSALTYEGIFYEYFFNLDKNSQAPDVDGQLFVPSYCSAISYNPLTKDKELFLSVGLKSGIKEEDFKRNKLNILIVLDNSGSMGSPFDGEMYGTSKMQVAVQNVVSLLGHLTEEDNFGVIAFDDTITVIQKITSLRSCNMGDLKQKILKIAPRGGTDMGNAMHAGHKMLKEFKNNNPEYSTRMVFLTDAMPTVGAGPDDIAKHGELMANEENPIYTTYIGVGIDFDTRTVERITKIQGANYFCVQSSADFKKRLDDEFEFMVTPVMFNFTLKFVSEDYKISDVYGSPDQAIAKGELVKINTLFPAKNDDEEGGKGGVVLLQLEKIGEGNGTINLEVSYKDRRRNEFKQNYAVTPFALLNPETCETNKEAEPTKQISEAESNQNSNGEGASKETNNENGNDTNKETSNENGEGTSKETSNQNGDSVSKETSGEGADKAKEEDNKEPKAEILSLYANNGIRKAILLSRYVKLIKSAEAKDKQVIDAFKTHFTSEMLQINDLTLDKELEMFAFLPPPVAKSRPYYQPTIASPIRKSWCLCSACD